METSEALRGYYPGSFLSCSFSAHSRGLGISELDGRNPPGPPNSRVAGFNILTKEYKRGLHKPTAVESVEK